MTVAEGVVIEQESKMALFEKLNKSDDDDEEEDLEALRRAALQTLGSNKPAANSSSSVNNTLHLPQQIPVPGPGPGRVYRGGMVRSRLGRNPVFQRHRLNSNLIAIVPMSNEPSPRSDTSPNQKTERAMLVATSTGPKLELPQHRYCKVETDQENKGGGPVVSTKFSRYEDSNSHSSADESEDENGTSDKVSLGSGVTAELDNDPDVLMVAVDDEEDSLEKLMNELEQEMNRSDANVHMNSNVKSSSDQQKQKKTLAAKTKRNICDTIKSHKSQGGVSTSEVVPVLSNSSNQKTKQSSHSGSLECTKDMSASASQINVSSSSISIQYKDNILHERDRNAKSGSIPQKSHTSPKPVAMLRKQLSPISSRKSRSRSISPHSCSTSLPKGRRCGSRSPRSRFSYSPVRNRSPRSRYSRSPVYLSRSRSRSPMRPLKSPRKRYSRSPQPWHKPISNHASRFSTQRQSPRPRRPISPRQSPSWLNRMSPHRSPESKWWASPHRSLSPRLRRSSLSPPPKRLISPRARSSVSPRRPLTPLRRKMSPSPARRNPSPPRRYSPLRRNPSPPRGRYSRSLSRSPTRFISRGKSPPGSRPLHHGSPLTPKRRVSRSPSVRRRLSHSPYNRLAPKHSPSIRKLSPWSPRRQPLNQRTSPAVRRYSASPSGKQRSPSPYRRQRRQSNSPNRIPAVSRLPPRTHWSPVRDLHRPSQESRLNNIHTRSQSPPLLPHLHPDPNIHRGHSPRHSRSPLHRSHSHTSSISLSPSPERGTINNIHRYKSPLRLHVAEYRNHAVAGLQSSKEGNNVRLRNLPSPVPVPGKKPLKTRSSKRKEPRRKRDRSKEYTKKDSDEKSKEELRSVAGESNPVLDSSAVKNSVQISDTLVSGSNVAVLEARRRKFESAGPVKPDGKKICLRTTQPQQQMQLQKEQDRKMTRQTPPKHMPEVNDKEAVTAIMTLDDSAPLETGEDIDEPYLELQSADLWSSEESDSDNEARFKSSARIQVAESEKVEVPFTKPLGQTKPVVRKEEVLTKRKKSSSRKTSSGDKVYEDAKMKKGLENVRSQVGDSQQKIKKGTGKQHQCEKEVQNKAEGAANNSNTVDSKLKHSTGDGNNDAVEELVARSREGDLRAELSRRRAERLTKAGSLHESLPARLLQSAFEGVVGKKGIKRIEREDKSIGGKRTESKKEKNDVRRVLVLKRPAVTERRVASISVTIPKESKHELNVDSPPTRIPIRLRLGRPTPGSPPEDRLMPRRRNRKVKLKRNVMLGPRPDDKV
ncbi:serine/arginine repetitive matrix protein 2-like [Zootermopsis nevadensis]|uniref:serine/arginine repetitive matrix protein 2-like n=1 Tax=Zootermopsis nevadensis TaxID=136037 RepID=UPI000B8E728B|nr:serine/arginine repetitive matrix protein 2-like [Zootermopsis nevadensis]